MVVDSIHQSANMVSSKGETMKLTQKIRKEARKIAGGLYQMNAKLSDRYGFCVSSDGKDICYGEFLTGNESETRVEWILTFATNKFRPAHHE